MLKVRYTNQFKKDYKLIKKRGYDFKNRISFGLVLNWNLKTKRLK